MGTVIVGAVLLAVVGFVIKTMVHDKKTGKSCHCGGSCGSCGGQCH